MKTQLQRLATISIDVGLLLVLMVMIWSAVYFAVDMELPALFAGRLTMTGIQVIFSALIALFFAIIIVPVIRHMFFYVARNRKTNLWQ